LNFGTLPDIHLVNISLHDPGGMTINCSIHRIFGCFILTKAMGKYQEQQGNSEDFFCLQNNPASISLPGAWFSLSLANIDKKFLLVLFLRIMLLISA
jgi:hypothetical protein